MPSDKPEYPSEDWLRTLVGQLLEEASAKRVAVAVSGGGDSMSCLELVRGHSDVLGFELRAVTVDHGLRQEAKDEIALVSAYCKAHGIAHDVLVWKWDGEGNLQAKARNARYRLIADWARDQSVDLVTLGHTEDDVAENFLIRLTRKSGVDGLASMDVRFERYGIRWLRPLLGFCRADLRSFLGRQGISWADDPSNEDPRYDRVKARKALDALEPLGIDVEAIAAVSRNLKSSRVALHYYVQEVASLHVKEDRGDLLLPVGTNPDIPMDTLYRLRREAIRWMSGAEYSPRSEALFDLAIRVEESGAHTLGGCVISLAKVKSPSENLWRITREHNAVKDLRCATDQLWDGRWRLEGPHANDLEIRALGEAVKDTPWRETGMPRQSLLASPAVWRGDELVAAPVAGLANGWTASATGRGNFADFLLSR